MALYLEELTKSNIHWLVQSTDIDYPTITNRCVPVSYIYLSQRGWGYYMGCKRLKQASELFTSLVW